MAIVLVIDDDPQMRAVLCRALERSGHTVSEAANGAAGMERFRQTPADLVVTDMEMPVQGGIETIGQLKNEFPQTRIIAISGSGAHLADARRAANGGADAWLTKPFALAEFLQAVERVLARSPARE
jgi:CheY-like chemotaxis protein